jgi:hypothetical protein
MAPTQVVVGAALREGDDAHPVAPAGQVRVAGEEALSSASAARPSRSRSTSSSGSYERARSRFVAPRRAGGR